MQGGLLWYDSLAYKGQLECWPGNWDPLVLTDGCSLHYELGHCSIFVHYSILMDFSTNTADYRPDT